MSFFNLPAFIGLLSVPAILAMYFFKKKNQEKVIGSIMLWRMATNDTKSEKAFQKLKKNLLMILQIIVALLIVFSLARPYVAKSEKIENMIIIIDTSMSMKAYDGEVNRFESEKAVIRNMIENGDPNSRITLIKAENEPEIITNRENEKNIVLERLESLQAGNGAVNIKSAVQTAEMIAKEEPATIYLFTDKEYEKDGINVITMGESENNCAVMSMTSEINENGAAVMVRVKNFGNVKAKKTLYLYEDGKVTDSRELILEPDEEKMSIFSHVNTDTDELMASIDEDCLDEDNVRYGVLNREESKKVYLYSKGNIFLESAVKILPNIKLYKGEEKEKLSGYDLYIFDGAVPEELPKDGHIIIFDPNPDNSLIKCGDEVNISDIKTIGKTMQNLRFDISKSRKMETPDWAHDILSSPETSLAVEGEIGGKKAIIFGFDLHNTDLPLKKEFPIMIYEIISMYLPQDIVSGEVYANEGTQINAAADSTDVKVITPSARMINISDGYLSDTKETGIYCVSEKTPDGEKISRFAVNTNNLFNSDLKRSNVQSGESERLLSEIESNTEFQIYLMIILLVMVFAEWWVYNYSR